MAETLSKSRNNSSKCSFNDTGFCKFKAECRKQHFQNICDNQNCDKNCMNRHPKACKDKEKCKFLKKNNCAYNHDVHAEENSDVQGEAERIIEIGNLKHLLSKYKVEIESKVKSLTEAMDVERKKTQEHESTKKELIKKNVDLERLVSKEMKELNLKIVKLETSERDLKLKIKNNQTEVNNEIKSCKDKIVCQQKVVTEMLTKEKAVETKVKDLENIHKIEIDKLNQEIYMLKTNAEKLVNNHNDNVEDVSNVVVKELKGRNVTILKTNTVNGPPKTPAVISSIATVEEIKDSKKDSPPKKDSTVIVESVLKTKPRKLKKEEKENLITKDFEDDCRDIFTVKTNCGLELSEHKCKKCEYETHSLGLLRNHNKIVHKLKESFQNILIGFENDLRAHLYLLETMEEPTNKFKCDQCAFATHSKGKLRVHEYEMH